MIICIGREFGSGGYEIGKRLAEKSGLSFYDYELVEAAVKRGGIEAGILEKADEKRANPWMHKVLYQSGEKELNGLSANDITFQLQSREILWTFIVAALILEEILDIAAIFVSGK